MELKKVILDNIEFIKNDINLEPDGIKNIFNTLFGLFDDFDKNFDEHGILLVFIYFVIRSMYVGPECVLQSSKFLQECVLWYENDQNESGYLNLYNDDGSRVTMKELGIEEDEK